MRLACEPASDDVTCCNGCAQAAKLARKARNNKQRMLDLMYVHLRATTTTNATTAIKGCPRRPVDSRRWCATGMTGARATPSVWSAWTRPQQKVSMLLCWSRQHLHHAALPDG